jgi:hypothetical protein
LENIPSPGRGLSHQPLAFSKKIIKGEEKNRKSERECAEREKTRGKLKNKGKYA